MIRAIDAYRDLDLYLLDYLESDDESDELSGWIDEYQQ